MRSHRVATVMLAIVTLISAIAAYLLFIHQAGFPDGYRTDLARARIVVSWLYIVVSLIIAGFSTWQTRTPNPVPRHTRVAAVLFVVITLCFGVGIHLLSAILDNGTGG